MPRLGYGGGDPFGRGLEAVAVDLLKLAKKQYDYKTLSKATGLPTSTLSRYITNKTFPRGEKARKLIERILPLADPPKLIRERVVVDEDVADVSGLVSDPNVLKILNVFVVNEFSGSKITTIMPLDTYSIPLATALGMAADRKIVLLSERPIWDDDEMHALTYRVPGFVGKVKLWLPKKAVTSKDSVLMLVSFLANSSLVDSVVRFLQVIKAMPTGVFAIAAREHAWSKLNLPPGIKKKCLLIV